MSNETHQTFKAGQVVRTIYGQTRTVVSQGGPNNCMVFLNGEFGWFHPTKIFPIVVPTGIVELNLFKYTPETHSQYGHSK